MGAWKPGRSHDTYAESDRWLHPGIAGDGVARRRGGGKEEEGFRPIFDGKTLEGWTTFDPAYWSVEDGAITAKITKEHPLSNNRYLIWKGATDAPGGRLADFELKLKCRIRGDGAINNGFQFRSRLMDNGWDVAGYQVDNNLNINNGSPWLVRLTTSTDAKTWPTGASGRRSTSQVEARSSRSRRPPASPGSDWKSGTSTT